MQRKDEFNLLSQCCSSFPSSSSYSASVSSAWINSSSRLSVCVCQSVCPSICLSMCVVLDTHSVSVCLPVCMCVCVSLSVFFCMSMCLSVHLSVSVCTCVCVCVCLSVCSSILPPAQWLENIPALVPAVFICSHKSPPPSNQPVPIYMLLWIHFSLKRECCCEHAGGVWGGIISYSGSVNGAHRWWERCWCRNMWLIRSLCWQGRGTWLTSAGLWQAVWQMLMC